MAIDLMMPALSPTMEKGTIARWLVAIGDVVKPGDLLAEIETDKATMEFEAVDQGRIGEILIAEGTDDVPVGAVIARLTSSSERDEYEGAPPAAETESASAPASSAAPVLPGGGEVAQAQLAGGAAPEEHAHSAHPPARFGDRAGSSALAQRLAAGKGIDIAKIAGSGRDGRVTLRDIVSPTAAGASPTGKASGMTAEMAPQPVQAAAVPDVPHEVVRLSGMRKVIARRLTESKQQVPHIYLTVDVRLDALLALRTELNDTLATRGIKLSVNDMIIKAHALALLETPACNVQYTPESLLRFSRADIAVAVSIPDGLITPIIADAGSRSLSSIATTMRALVVRAREGKLQPHEYQGGTASLSNLGMFGIRQFAAVINPPQAMILAVGVGERRAIVVDGEIVAATVATITGSFDHRAIDGSDAAAFMSGFRRLVQHPLDLIA